MKLPECMSKNRYDQVVATPTTRDKIIRALETLPPDANIDDAIERLVLMAKVEEGLADVEAGRVTPHAEVKRQFGV